MTRGVTLTLEHQVDLDNKIAAIKAYRELTGEGLKEAKNAIESIRPGKFTSAVASHKILQPQFNDIVFRLRMSGLIVQVVHENDPARDAIGEEIHQLANWATLAGQYDLAKALIDVAEAHCIPATADFNIEDEIKKKYETEDNVKKKDEA